MEDEKKLNRYKWIFYITVLLTIAIIESTVLSHVNILGGKPQLLIFSVSVIAMLEGVNGGASAGLVAGLFMDAMCAPVEGFYTVAYVVCGVVVSIINEFTYHKTYPVSLLFWLAAVLVCDTLYYVFHMLVMGEGSPLLILKILPGELLATVLFTPILYIILLCVYRRFAIEE